MNYNNTDSPSSSRQESLEGFTPPFAHGSHENCRKKRTKVVHIADPIWRHSNSSFKLKQRKKPEPGAPKITRPCSECGKQFWSWKALFGHMRCHPERQWRGINPPPNFRSMLLETPAEGLREKFTEEDHEVATCLVMLSNGPTVIDVDRGQPESGDSIGESLVAGDVDRTIPSGLNCRFECSSCKRVFGSHQALGGHRATHKNVKGCFAIARNDGEDEDRNCGHRIDTGGEEEMKETGEEKALILVHKCSICLRVFSSGQALGGHMRCHWEKGYEPSLQGLNPSITREGCVLDLNMPASVENDESSSSSGLALDLRLGI